MKHIFPISTHILVCGWRQVYGPLDRLLFRQPVPCSRDCVQHGRPFHDQRVQRAHVREVLQVLLLELEVSDHGVWPVLVPLWVLMALLEEGPWEVGDLEEGQKKKFQ